ncbi:hypothetical protein BJ165DRAFT_1532668 [Panaeolus papilionaceus]|nr:hypothetical protein BJ165DRAFT_1532668 [Panaeolus papilionaceus]
MRPAPTGGIYQPCLNNPDHPPPPCLDSHIIGVFTMNGSVVQHLHHAGVPVWFIQEWDGTPLRRNVLEVVEITMPRPPFRMGDYSPPFPTILCGLMTNEQCYTSICTYLLKRQLSPVPFVRGINESASAIASTSSTSAWVAPSNPVPHKLTFQGPNRPPKPKKKKQDPNTKVEFTGRNKFEPVAHPFALYSIPAWCDALSAVDYSPARIVDQASANRNSNQYVFPDPGLIMHSKHIDLYILNWLQVDRVWTFFVVEGGTLSPQDWRHLLFLDFSKPPPDGDTPTRKRSRELYEKLRTRANQFSTSVQLVDGFSTAPTWNGQPVTTPVAEKTKLEERERMIRACFAPARFKLPKIDLQNIGLASNKIEDRLPYIIALGKVVKSWTLNPDPVLLLCDRRQPELHFDQPHHHGLERVVTQVYCQTFWNYFGRAAQIPYRLHQ